MADDRLTALCEQAPARLTGIDFIEVVQPHVQTLLRVFFVIDPDALVAPMVVGVLPQPAPTTLVEITPVAGRTSPGGVGNAGSPLHVPVVVRAVTWSRVPTPAGNRTVLDVQVDAPGDFSFYRLTIRDEPLRRVDRFFNGVLFTFKQGCPSVFDCRRHRDCPPEEEVDWPVDYLARDFESLRNALLDFSAQKYPLWRERIPADQGAMLMELAAALGDEFAYIQDRIGFEAALGTLTERRSLRRHARLVDYLIDDGASATSWLDIQMAPGVQQVIPPGTRVWATPEGEPPIPFEVGHGLADESPNLLPGDLAELNRLLWMSAAWNMIPAHVPDPGKPCLEAGTIELYVVGQFPLAAQLPALANPATFWIGRPVLIRTDPKDPSKPARRRVVQLTEVEQTLDTLLVSGGGPLPITRLRWRVEDALPFDLCLEETTIHANLAPVSAGQTFTEYFAIGTTPDPVCFPLAVERQGPLNALDGTRPPIFLRSLMETEERGLGRMETEELGLDWLTDGPEVELSEVTAGFLPVGAFWEWRASLIEARSEDPYFTLDDGTWRKVISFDRTSGRYEHVDRASGAGMTIRFGDGEFGRVPREGMLFKLRYRTDVGLVGNLPADSIRGLSDPRPPAPAPLCGPGIVTPTLRGIATAVSNPLAVTDGRDAQDMESVKQFAPEAYKARPRRAVRDEDYRAIAERLDWVQRAGATSRWTGSWLTEFVTVDPKNALGLSAPLRSSIEREMNCVRQAGRPVAVRAPVYLPVDLRIMICVQPSAYEGQVIERVTAALAGPTRPGRPLPFFHPDHFTFGTPLNRAALESAIQAVPGVHGVEEIRLRVRGRFNWRVFSEFVFPVSDDRILRLDNDPDHPESGALIVTTRGLAT